MPQRTTEQWAFAYLARGWPVIPVEPLGKRPLVPWEEFQYRQPGAEELRAWLGRWPDANLAVVTGLVSGLVVLDVDPRHEGDDSLAALERRHGALPHSIEALSGGGGRHIYFAHPGRIVHNKVGLAPGVDLRADGGVVVVPPSVHASGRAYAWELSHHPDETPLAPMPPWLLALILGDRPHPGHTLGHWRRLVSAGVAEGARNDTIASLTGHLLWHGVDPEVILELLLAWNRLRCRPPLADDEVSRTVESIRSTHLRHHSPRAATPR